jgi:hypothetical protein
VRAVIYPAFALILPLAGGTSACWSDDSARTTIQELMTVRVDPAADALWDSVATIVSAAGVEERRPRTAAEWQAVRLQALALIGATELLGTRGRRVTDTTIAPGPGELTAPEIQRRIDASHDAFAGFASALRVAGQQALAAIDARDPRRLMDAGGVIDAACEACHLSFWYPTPTPWGSGAKP